MPLLRVVEVEVDAGRHASFARWYEDVHVPEVLACPGWGRARRYECADGTPRFVALYDIEEGELPFSTAEFKAIANWAGFEPDLRASSRRSYRRVSPEGHARDVPAVRFVGFEVRRGAAPDVERWCVDVAVPAFGAATCHRAADGEPVFLLSHAPVEPARSLVPGWGPHARDVVRWHARTYRLVSDRSSAEAAVP